MYTQFKKSFTGLLALLLALTLCLPAIAASPFSDVPAGTTLYESVAYLPPAPELRTTVSGTSMCLPPVPPSMSSATSWTGRWVSLLCMTNCLKQRRKEPPSSCGTTPSPAAGSISRNPSPISSGIKTMTPNSNRWSGSHPGPTSISAAWRTAAGECEACG